MARVSGTGDYRNIFGYRLTRRNSFAIAVELDLYSRTRFFRQGEIDMAVRATPSANVMSLSIFLTYTANKICGRLNCRTNILPLLVSLPSDFRHSSITECDIRHVAFFLRCIFCLVVYYVHKNIEYCTCQIRQHIGIVQRLI